jgi:site-specific recombinase XerD
VSIGPRAGYPLRTADRPGIARALPPQARKPVVAVCVRIRAWAPLSAEGFPRTVKRAGVVAKLGIKAHAHMLRHACGFKLANDGIDTRALQAYFGHSNIQNTARYTALASGRFKNFWRD